MFSFTGNKKSVAGGGANTFYGKPGLQFYTQQKTVTSLWRSEDAVATKAQKAALGKLDGDAIAATELAGEPITAKLSRAPGNEAAVGGLKVVSENAWFAARPSGTEDVYKIYAESFQGTDHLHRVQEEARRIVDEAISGA